MNLRAVGALVGRDLTALLRSRGVLIPLAVVPAVLLVLFPAILGMAPTTVGVPDFLMYELVSLSQVMPESFRVQFVGMTTEELWVTLTLLNFMVPFYLVVPLTVASVIAADSFAGERERSTLESLVYTPTSDLELFTAKLLSALLPAVGVGLLSFVAYGLTVNLSAWPIMQELFFPTPEWIALALWMGPATAALGLSLGVLVSARVRTVQEATQIGSVVVLPVVMMVVGQLSGRLYLDLPRVLILGGVLWAVDLGLLIMARRWCRRDVLMSRR